MTIPADPADPADPAETETRRGDPREGRTWPTYLFGGRLRTSTLGLIVAFMAIWWLYDTYQPTPPPPGQVPAAEIVPPGFVPDPSYTWVPRSEVQRYTPTTATPTSTIVVRRLVASGLRANHDRNPIAVTAIVVRR